ILRADTLWIDTDNALCTVTFRGMAVLQSADEHGRVVVSMEPDRPSMARADEPSGVFRPPRRYEMTADIPLEMRQPPRAALPFARAAPAPLSGSPPQRTAVLPDGLLALAGLAPTQPPAIAARAPEPPPAAPPPGSPWVAGGHLAEASAVTAPP